MLVVALGAEYDVAATPGLVEAGNEFYSVAGAAAVRDILPGFGRDGHRRHLRHAVQVPARAQRGGVPARRDLRQRASVTRHDPGRDARSAARCRRRRRPRRRSSTGSRSAASSSCPERKVVALDPATHEAVLGDGTRLPFDLFLGVPVHRVPDVVRARASRENGWIPVDRGRRDALPGRVRGGRRDQRRHAQGRRVRGAGGARGRGPAHRADPGRGEPPGYDGTGACWIEFGAHEVARVDVDFFADPGKPRDVHGAVGADCR